MTTTDTITAIDPAVKNRIATNAARAVLKDLPEHTFNTGAVGRDMRQRITIGGKVAYVSVQVVFKDKESPKAKPKAKRTAKA